METTLTLEPRVSGDVELDIDLDIRTTTWDTAQNSDIVFPTRFCSDYSCDYTCYHCTHYNCTRYNCTQ